MKGYKETEKCNDSRKLNNGGCFYTYSSNGRAPSISLTSESKHNKVYSNSLLIKIVSEDNLLKAAKKVKSNKGSSGIDTMKAYDAVKYIEESFTTLRDSLIDGSYTPLPVRRITIPKSNGRRRKLGIPSVKDRIVQQAIVQVLDPIFDEKFSNNSFGFRRGRSQHNAVAQCKAYLEEGYTWLVDLDLEAYFDTVNHDKLIGLIYKEVEDTPLITLIRKFLNAGAVDKRFMPSKQGVPQGGNLSPLLSNIMLNELDEELHKRHLRFVRYADDCIIFANSQRAAERIIESITRFIENDLKLKVNPDKSKIIRPQECKHLGFGFYLHGNKAEVIIHDKSVQKLKTKLESIITNNDSSKVKRRIKQQLKGWYNYYSETGNIDAVKAEIEQWLIRKGIIVE